MREAVLEERLVAHPQVAAEAEVAEAVPQALALLRVVRHGRFLLPHSFLHRGLLGGRGVGFHGGPV